MHSLFAPALALAALTAIPAVTAHGYVSGVVTGGKWYPGASPNWIYAPEKPQQAGWFAYNQDTGFVAPSAYSDEVSSLRSTEKVNIFADHRIAEHYLP